MNRPLIVLMSLFIMQSVASQKSYIIKGKITNESDQSLPFVTVFVEGLGIGTVSDETGNYLLKSVPEGTHTLSVSLLGYQSIRQTVNVTRGNLYNVNFKLAEATQKLDEVVVQGKSNAQKLKESAQAVTVVRTETVKLQTADLGDIMAKTEGVSVQRAGGLGSNIRFSLNGLSGDQIRFFYDGIPLNFTPYSFGIANVPVNAIERVEVYKGVVPIQFGADALGGAVNLVPPEVNQSFGGSASYQTGSFGTHRATLNLQHYKDNTGFFANAGAFYDFTDNNYKIDVAIPNDLGQLRQETVERFHDAYRAYGVDIQLGVRNKKWAKVLSLKGYYGDYNNEIQNSQAPGLVNQPQFGLSNAVAGNPFGEIVFTSFSTGVNLHYNLSLTKKWELDLKAGYNYTERESFDVSNNLYNWFGEIIRVQNQPGEFGEADNLLTIGKSVFARQQIIYKINEKHQLNLSLSPSYTFRTGDDLLIDGPFDPALDEGELTDMVTGLEYQLELSNKKLQIIAFVKNYQQNIRIESLDASVIGTQVDQRRVSEFGAGNGLRLNWSERFLTKLSYEYAIRLPRQDEIFGDGQLIVDNLDLRPEASHNVNLALTYDSKSYTKVAWQLGTNFFLRRIDDLIFLLVNQNDLGSFQNVWSATSIGIEFNGRVSNLIKGLTLNGNLTYQDYRNTSDTGPFVQFRDDRIPNIPYFFANGEVNYGFDDIAKNGDNLALFWNWRHVHSFFVGWESAGLQEFKVEVPDQTIHAAGLTYKTTLKKFQNAITLEIQNLTDAKVFDFFGVQRPGRAVFLKLTTQF
ncbi:MAG: carboxypeptidase-like regulatory domain-containing protein [Bacteroidota bacterium]